MERLCQNCGSPLDGDYCAECGQSKTTLDIPVADFAKELASETFGLDSRLRLTLRPLFLKPGQVPKEFVEGRRARFVPPIRLYLFASFAMFLVLTFGNGLNVQETSTSRDDADETVAALAVDSIGAQEEPGLDATRTGDASPDTPAEDTIVGDSDASPPGSETPSEGRRGNVEVDLGGGELEATIEERFSEGFQRIAEDRERFSRDFLGRLAQAFFVLLPAFAFLLKLTHWKRLYVHHVVFSIYFHGFVFLLMTVVGLPDVVGLWGVSDVLALLLLWVPVYLVLAMKRFYGESWPRTLIKAFLVSAAYNVLGVVTMISILVMTLLWG